jgi:hypothetical protein
LQNLNSELEPHLNFTNNLRIEIHQNLTFNHEEDVGLNLFVWDEKDAYQQVYLEKYEGNLSVFLVQEEAKHLKYEA